MRLIAALKDRSVDVFMIVSGTDPAWLCQQ